MSINSSHVIHTRYKFSVISFWTECMNKEEWQGTESLYEQETKDKQPKMYLTKGS